MDKKITGLAILVVILVALNIFQFYYFNYMTNNVPAEDVPMQLMDLKGDKWRDYIGKKVTVEGYFFSVGGDYPILVSNLTFLYLRDEMPNEDYIRLDGTIPQALQGGARYT